MHDIISDSGNDTLCQLVRSSQNTVDHGIVCNFGNLLMKFFIKLTPHLLIFSSIQPGNDHPQLCRIQRRTLFAARNCIFPFKCCTKLLVLADITIIQLEKDGQRSDQPGIKIFCYIIALLQALPSEFPEAPVLLTPLLQQLLKPPMVSAIVRSAGRASPALQLPCLDIVNNLLQYSIKRPFSLPNFS